MGRSLNAASSHPRFDLSEDYYRHCADLKVLIAGRLQAMWNCEHRLFLTQNTTQGLILVLAWCGGRGLIPLGFSGTPYKYYSRFLQQAGLAVTESLQNPRALLVTHMSPLSGAITPLPEYSPSLPIIVDAAQTLGTFYQSEVFKHAAIFVGPLHKHIGLASGLGILGVSMRWLGESHGNEVCALAECAGCGLTDARLLEEAWQRLRNDDGFEYINNIRIFVGDRLSKLAERLDCELITPMGLQGHTVSLRSKNKEASLRLLCVAKIIGRWFSRESILRISLHSWATGDLSPSEAEEFICAQIETINRDGM